jgi:tetratricopeptide (TPR) repeat protein
VLQQVTASQGKVANRPARKTIATASLDECCALDLLEIVDQLSAHLDRGWDLAQRGDGAGALACGERALDLDPQSPEAHNLLGYSSAMLGETEEALDHYKQAIALDETYFEAMLNATELLLAVSKWDEAINFSTNAYTLAESDDELRDALLLKIDALLGKQNMGEAKRVLSLLPKGEVTTPHHNFLIGRAHYELGEIALAKPHFEACVEKDGAHGDALYYLGMCRDDAGDRQGSVEALLRSRLADMMLAPPPWSPDPDAFMRLVEDALSQLPAAMLEIVKNAEVYCVDLPGAEIVIDGADPRAGAIYDAPPPGMEGRARLFIYQRNLERSAASPSELPDEVKTSVEREIIAFAERAEAHVGPPKAHELN